MLILKSGMQNTAIGIECASARQQMEGESKLRRTHPRLSGREGTDLRGASEPDDGQVPSADEEGHTPPAGTPRSGGNRVAGVFWAGPGSKRGKADWVWAHGNENGMNTEDNIIQRLHAALPGVRLWIDDFLGRHADQARTVHSLGFKRLALFFPKELLELTKVVELTRVPFPPVERFGLPEFASMQQMQFAGITFKDTFFLQQGQSSESLHFHELVHVVQWARLGVEHFLLAIWPWSHPAWVRAEPPGADGLHATAKF